MASIIKLLLQWSLVSVQSIILCVSYYTKDNRWVIITQYLELVVLVNEPWVIMVYVATVYLFKPGALRPVHAWFLIIASVRECLYFYVCVSAPKAMNNQWRDVA